MANTVLGKVSLTPRGEYDAATAYVPLDLVRHEGRGYIVLRGVTGVTPVDGDDYMLLVDKGSNGDPGSSIQEIARTSGTGAAGTTDTYTITLTDGSTTTFSVYNGADGIGSGDMTKTVYDPQGKNTDVFQYVDDALEGFDPGQLTDVVTMPGGAEITAAESIGVGPYTIYFDEEEDDISAASLTYDNTASGLTANTVQAAIDELKTLIGTGTLPAAEEVSV